MCNTFKVHRQNWIIETVNVYLYQNILGKKYPDESEYHQKYINADFLNFRNIQYHYFRIELFAFLNAEILGLNKEYRSGISNTLWRCWHSEIHRVDFSFTGSIWNILFLNCEFVVSVYTVVDIKIQSSKLIIMHIIFS